MKAKLAYLCSSESWGGLEMNHLRDAIWMKERGHSVIILAVKDSPFYAKSSAAGLTVHPILKQKKYYDFKRANILVKTIRSQEISHLIIRTTYDISLAATVKYKMKSQIITTYILGMQLGVKKTNLLHTIRFKYIDIWICPLEYLAQQVREWTRFRNKLVVIPSGLDLAYYQSGPSKEAARQALNLPSSNLIFGLIGRFDEQKGQLLLLEAMAKTRNTNYSIVFLGEPTKNEGDAYYKSVLQIINQSGFHDRIFMKPFSDDTRTFYHSLDWLIMATKAETFGMVTIEAMACGVPVLGSDAGGTPEILNNETGGILFKPLDTVDLAAKIDKICNGQVSYNPTLLKSMSMQYDHRKVCDQVEEVLGLKSL